MKLFMLKLMSLLVLAAGIAIAGLTFGAACVVEPIANLKTMLVELGEVKLMFLKGGGGVLLALAGLYGFLPRLPRRPKNREVTYRGVNGNSVIDLDAAQAKLTQILANMPEIKKIQIELRADEEDNKVIIDSVAVLRNEPGAAARTTCERVNGYIREAATSLLGLEVQSPITLRVKSFDVDAKSAGKKLRERCTEEAAQRGNGEVRMESRMTEDGGQEALDEPFRLERAPSPVAKPVAAPVAAAVEAEEDAAPEEAEDVLPPLALASFDETPASASEEVTEGLPPIASTAFGSLESPAVAEDDDQDPWAPRS